MIHGFNDETKEKVKVVDGTIATYSQNVEVPADTWGYSIPFQIMNEPEASDYSKYVVLSFAQYSDSGNTRRISIHR